MYNVPRRALEAVLAYVSRQRKDLIPVGDLTEPLSSAEFAKAAGFLREQAWRTELLVPAARFRHELPSDTAMMPGCAPRGARPDRGRRAAEADEQVPGAVCATGRVYRVMIDPATA